MSQAWCVAAIINGQIVIDVVLIGPEAENRAKEIVAVRSARYWQAIPCENMENSSSDCWEDAPPPVGESFDCN